MPGIDYLTIGFTPVRDTSIYTQAVIQNGKINQITLHIPPDSSLAEGTILCIQYLVKQLLTAVGSNLFIPTSGTSIVNTVGNMVNQESIRALTVEITNILSRVLGELQALQIIHPPNNQDDLLTSISLANLSFDQGSSTISIRIVLQFVGRSIPIVFEV